MSIDMYVSSSQEQATSVNTMCQKQIQGYTELQQAINQFVMSSAELQGKTYDSAKQYFSAVLLPLSKGGMLLSEAVAKACQKFPDDYQSKVDSGDLKSSELEEQIQQYQQGIDTANAILQSLSTDPALSSLMQSVRKGVKSVKEGQEKAKKKLEEKLKKLEAFDASSPSIFAEIATLESAVNTGAAQAGTCWNAGTGTFTLPRQEDMAWVSDINGYEDRAKKQAEKEKLKELEKYNVYAVSCRDADGKPTVMWLLEDPKSGRKVNNPELLEFLNMKGAKLDPGMFQILTLDGFEEKVAGSWRKGVEYFSGKEYTGLQKIGVQGLQGIQDFAESDYAELLRLMGFAYGVYRISTANGPIEVEVKPKVNVVSNKKFKNATLVNGKNNGSYTKSNIILDGSHLTKGKLKSNIEYTTGEYNYRYKTDTQGRVNNFKTENLQYPNTPGKLQGDHAGHLAGDRFGGSPEIDNLISQSSKVNQSSYRKIENKWDNAIRDGKRVSVNVKVNYEGNGLRPERIFYRW